MARKRLIDTDGLYFSTELVEILGARGLHLYIRLWGISEDWGGYEPKFADIALQMGALKFTPKEVEELINKLINRKKIAVYEKKGVKVHWIANFLEHQPLDNPSLPKLPLPEWIKCKILSYKSGKKYANYRLIHSRLPVGYSSTTGNGVTVTVTVTKQNSNSKETVSPLSDENFLKDLKTNSVYKHINFDFELGKMDAWLSTRPGRKKTRRFIVNWLNKIEAPVNFAPKPKPKADPTCDICQGKGRIPDGQQKGAQCLCVK